MYTMAQKKAPTSAYRLVSDRQVNLWNYASQLEVFSQRVSTKLYGYFKVGYKGEEAVDYPYGSVFNLEFSPLEDIAVTVCASRAILAYDPRTSTKIHTVPHAHDDCVNCVTFLDNFTFATCSDDHTIRLWDLRNLRRCTAVLRGHRNWVKNIEYDQRSGILFSIAFFDGVRSWDLNKLDSYTNEEDSDNLVLALPDPVRMRISPDGSKMFVTMRKNVSLVVHDFDGRHLKEIKNTIGNLMRIPHDRKLLQQLKQRKTNKPSIHVMSGLRGTKSFRAVMSTVFHPSGDFMALRHIDVKDETLHQELTSLYDLREAEYSPVCRIERCQHNYLKFIDESSPMEALDYIKEISFSRDGRVLASPFEDGVRILAVDSLHTPIDVFFEERYHSVEKSLGCLELEQVGTCFGHQAPVLTCKFANNDFLLGTGCLQGRVLFHKPQL